ncbi:ABC transporter substrate-binding protein [Streptomyces sp. NPDC004610]|uniref:ABC transporter substrate-binding protein n=1 Tax=unclassified Streptomyces TaxID=2593676 RepID=UPI0033B6743C
MRSPFSSVPPFRPRLLAPLLITPLLAGCFSAGPGEDTTGDRADGSRLRIALAFPPAEQLSPYGADATILSRLGVTEGLTALDADGTAVPALATGWTRENDRTWEFTLREAVFQDGGEVTPAAVAAALGHAARAEPRPAALTGVTLTATARGDRAVRITTGAPDPVLPLRLASPNLGILSAKAYSGDTGDPVDPVGTATGPFELTEVSGATSATLRRNDDHWGDPARAAGIDVRFIADGTARAAALRTGQVDIAEAIPVAQAATLDEGTVRETATTRTTNLLLNSTTGAFRDPGLRAAARAAVDTAALTDGVYEGHADPGAGVYGPAVSWAGERRQQPTGRADAKDPDGTAITLATYDNRPELPEAAQVLKQQLEEAGFRVTLDVREYSRIESDALAGKFDAFVLARNSLVDTGDPVAILASDYSCDGGYNLAHLCDRGVDQAIAEAEGIADTERRRDATMTAEARLMATDAVIPLVHQRIITGVGESVREVRLDPYERTLVTPATRR